MLDFISNVFWVITAVILVSTVLTCVVRGVFNKQMKKIEKGLSENFEKRIKALELSLKKTIGLQDMIQSSSLDYTVREVYFEMKKIPDEEFPESHEEIIKKINKLNDSFFEKILEDIKVQINTAATEERKQSLQKKYEKLLELKTMSGLIDNQSSPEFIQTIRDEMLKIVDEINQTGSDYTDGQ